MRPLADLNDSCPEGFGCDAAHYHGTARAIGRVQSNGVADIRYDTNGSGWGYLAEICNTGTGATVTGSSVKWRTGPTTTDSTR